MHQDELWLLTEKYNGEKTEGFFADCARLATGEPLAYVIGTMPFLHTTIHLDSRPLIPRPETEFWVEHAIRTMQEQKRPLRVLDLCAGSGCIGVAILADVKEARVDFVEIDACHHPTIERTLKTNHIDPARTHIMGGDLFEHVTKTYDYILTNPPYIDPALDRTEASVRDFEPHEALFGGHEGLVLIERIIKEAGSHLTLHGEVWIEHEPEQVAAIHTLAQTTDFTPTTHTDQFGTLRYTVLSRKGI